ncbi:Rhodanese-related sulfurtransferase, partial [Methylomonas albis]
ERRTHCPYRRRFFYFTVFKFGRCRQPLISVRQLALVYRVRRGQFVSKRFYPILPAGNDLEKIGHTTNLPI